MSYRKIYPRDESIVFDGGLNSKFEKALITDTESPDCANVVFNNGSVATREGVTKLNTASAGSAAFDGIYTRRANDNSETMCVFIGGHMKALAATTFITIPSAQSVFTAGARVCAEMAENYLFIGNGGIVPHKWDGTLFTRHGVYPPTTSATVATNGAAGGLTASGVYQWKVTFINSALVESDLGPATASFTVSGTSGAANLTSIPIAPTSWGVGNRRLYRNKASDAATFYRVTGFNPGDNSTTTYTDTTVDTALGVQGPTDNAVPPNYSAIIYFKGRLFVNDPTNQNYVWYSTVTSPYTFPTSNFFKVGDNTSDLVKGFGVYDNALVIFCEKSTWFNYMNDPSDASTWRQARTSSPYGTKSPFGITPYQDKVLFPAIENGKFVGFSALKGAAVAASDTLLTINSTASFLQSDRIETDMFNVQSSYIGNISSISFKNKVYITLTYGTGATQNNRIYVYDFSLGALLHNKNPAWVPFTGLSAAQFTIYGGKLYYASSTNSGFVYQLLETNVYSDDGSAINSYYWTKEFSGFEQDTTFFKDFRYANLLVDNAGAYYMNLSYRVDSDKGSGSSTQINVNPGSSLWGTMVWGRDNWGGGTNQSETRVYLGTLRGKRVQFQFSNQNTAGQYFKVHRMNFSYNIRGLNR